MVEVQDSKKKDGVRVAPKTLPGDPFPDVDADVKYVVDQVVTSKNDAWYVLLKHVRFRKLPNGHLEVGSDAPVYDSNPPIIIYKHYLRHVGEALLLLANELED